MAYDLNRGYSKALRRFLERLLRLDPSERPDAATALELLTTMRPEGQDDSESDDLPEVSGMFPTGETSKRKRGGDDDGEGGAVKRRAT